MNAKTEKNVFEKKKRTVAKLLVIYILLLTVAALIISFVVGVNFGNKILSKRDQSIFGFGFYVVTSDSMSLSEENKDLDVHFDAGDIIIIKKTDALTLQAGDVISFVSMNEESKGEVVTHMIREVTRDADGQLAFRTYGTNTNIDDQALVTPGYILGEYVGKLPNVGSFFMSMKNTKAVVVNGISAMVLYFIVFPIAIVTAICLTLSFSRMFDKKIYRLIAVFATWWIFFWIFLGPHWLFCELLVLFIAP